MLQDEVVFVLSKTALTASEVSSLDLKAFRSLYDSVRRLDARERIELGWTMMIAAQHDGKKMEDWIKKMGLDKTSQIIEDTTKGRQGMQALIARFGSGF